jgi:hypothetical protein
MRNTLEIHTVKGEGTEEVKLNKNADLECD